MRIINDLRLHHIIFENTDNDVDVINTNCFIIFAKSLLVPSQFFMDRKEFLQKVNDGEVKIVFLDDDSTLRIQNIPPKAQRINVADEAEIKKWIKMRGKKPEKGDKRRMALKTKVGRLFYIYSEIYPDSSVSMEDILYRSGISKRTFHRDIELINEILWDKKVVLDCYGYYSFENVTK
jgi:hypothetical protein